MTMVGELYRRIIHQRDRTIGRTLFKTSPISQGQIIHRGMASYTNLRRVRFDETYANIAANNMLETSLYSVLVEIT